MPTTISQTPHAAEPLHALGEAIKKALAETSVDEVLSVLTGAFVGLTVEVLRRSGHESEKEIKIDGGSQRDITIHAKK
jgi:hypothetical protein